MERRKSWSDRKKEELERWKERRAGEMERRCRMWTEGIVKRKDHAEQK